MSSDRAVSGGGAAVAPSSRTEEAAILKANAVRKTYRLGRIDVPVLKGATLEVKAGEWVAIVGASGSGKSTLLHLLGDLDADDDGGARVLHRGVPMSALSPLERNRYRNRTVGFVFQFYHLLPELDVLENTMLPGLVSGTLRSGRWWSGVAAAGGVAGAGLAGAAATIAMPGLSGGALATAAVAGGVGGASILTAALSELGAIRTRLGSEYQAKRARARELLEASGLGHRLEHRPRELSGGERQRVAIARALMNGPEVLLADEPTGNLDQRIGGEILDLLAAQHARGMTLVMVTHDREIAARAQRCVTLRDGKVDGDTGAVGTR